MEEETLFYGCVKALAAGGGEVGMGAVGECGYSESSALGGGRLQGVWAQPPARSSSSVLISEQHLSTGSLVLLQLFHTLEVNSRH